MVEPSHFPYSSFYRRHRPPCPPPTLSPYSSYLFFHIISSLAPEEEPHAPRSIMNFGTNSQVATCSASASHQPSRLSATLDCHWSTLPRSLSTTNQTRQSKCRKRLFWLVETGIPEIRVFSGSRLNQRLNHVVKGVRASGEIPEKSRSYNFSVLWLSTTNMFGTCPEYLEAWHVIPPSEEVVIVGFSRPMETPAKTDTATP